MRREPTDAAFFVGCALIVAAAVQLSLFLATFVAGVVLIVLSFLYDRGGGSE